MLSAFSGACPARRTAPCRGLSAGAILVVAVGLAACGPTEARPLEFRQMSNSFYFNVATEPVPPRARETALFKIVVRDKKSRQPIETGIGRIFSSNQDEAKTWDLLTKGAEVGTYYGKLNFVTSGPWAIAIEFRRDSTARIEKVEWMQEVQPERADTP